MTAPTLIPEDWAAAEKVISKASMSSLEQDKAIVIYAAQHAELGHSEFCLKFGLRPPRNCRETWKLQLERYEISKAEYSTLIQEHDRQPVDREMAESLYFEIDECLDWLGRFFNSILRRDRDFELGQESATTAAQRDRYLAEFGLQSSLSQPQIWAVIGFAEQVRIERNWEPIVWGPFTDASALMLILTVLQNCRRYWDNSVVVAVEGQNDNRLGFPYPPEYFMRRAWGNLPALHALGSYLRQESAAVRLALAPEISVPPARIPEVQIVNQFQVQPTPVVINNHFGPTTVRGKSGTTSSNSPSPKPPLPNGINLKNWALGLEDGKRWRLFHRAHGRWDQRASVPIPSGHQLRLLTALASGRGALFVKTAIELQRPHYPGTEDAKILELIKNTISDLRQIIRDAISDASNWTIDSTVNPIRLTGDRWISELEVGLATRDEENQLRFELSSEA